MASRLDRASTSAASLTDPVTPAFETDSVEVNWDGPDDPHNPQK